MLEIATVADDIPAWGQYPALRDLKLREFWPTEPYLASALYTTVIRNAAFSWTLEGPPRTVKAYQQMFHEADLGGGWEQFCVKVLTDFYSQDNGLFIEIIRANNESPSSPVIGFAHLDAGRCRRTGVPAYPVVYIDRLGREHKMRPWQVIARAEYPSPVETMNGVGLCAVSRVLRSAQLLRDIGIYMREKVGGSNPNSIHLINGVASAEITDAMAAHRNTQEQRGNLRYMLPLIMASIDPTATMSHEQIDLAGLPDGFDQDTQMRWYIIGLAMAFGIDPQDLAPLQGQALGTGAQSIVLHMKSRGKGPAMYVKTMEHIFNFAGILPRNITFRFDEQDIEADTQQSALDKAKAETRQIYVAMGALTPDAARQLMLDDGEISQELFDAMQLEPDLTTDETAQDSEQAGSSPKRENQAAKEAAAIKANGDLTQDFGGEQRAAWESEMAGDFERALRSTFRDVRARILSNKGLLGLGGKDLRAAELLPDDPEFWEEFRLVMTRVMLSYSSYVARGAAEFSASLGLGVDMDLVNERVLELSRTFTNDWWQGIEATTRRSMRAAIVAWQETGLGERGLPDLVDAIEPLFGRARAEVIAMTETTRLFDEGNRLAANSAGITQQEFMTGQDELVCPICAPYDGQRFPTNEGPRPPLHPRCRCSRAPVGNAGLIFGKEVTQPEPVAVVVTTVEKQVIRDDSGRIDRVLETIRRG